MSTKIEYTKRFRKGKYINQQFSDVTDYSYMNWYLEKVEPENPYLQKILKDKKETGTEFMAGRYVGMKFTDVDDLKYMKWYLSKTPNNKHLFNRVDELLGGFQEKLKLVKEYKMATVTFHKNLDANGEITLPTGLSLRFENIKEYWYESWPYSLPVNEKGKGTRIKNKKFKVWLEPDIENIKPNVFIVKKMLKFC
jgi:hypothetical protein